MNIYITSIVSRLKPLDFRRHFILPTRTCAVITHLLLLTLLFISMIFDLRDREVPLPLTLGGLLGSGGIALVSGMASPVLLVLALILLSDLSSRHWRITLALVCTTGAGLLQPDTSLLCVLITVIWLFWESGMMGGADVKLLMVILLVTRDPAFLLPIFLAGGIQGLVGMLQKQKDIPFVVSIFCGCLLQVLFPIL